MTYTDFINKDKCNYLNAQTQTSDKMLLSCINPDITLNNSNNYDIRRTINTNSNTNIKEGFTNGGFSGNLSGEYNIKKGVCPDGHTMDENGCRQICTHCSYRDLEPNSRSMNESDICEPEGMFNGIDENGFIKCLRKNDNKEYLPLQAYIIDGGFLSNNPLHFLFSDRMY